MNSHSIQTAFAALQNASEKLSIELSAATSDMKLVLSRVHLSRALYEYIAELEKVREPTRLLGAYFYERSSMLISEARRLLESAYEEFPTYS